MIPTALLHSRVSDRAVRVWAILDDIARADPAVVLTLRSIAELLGRSRRSASAALAELLDAGFLDRVAGGGGASTYVPQRRPRPVDNPVHNPGSMLPGSTANLGSMLPRSARGIPLSARAGRREEAEHSAESVDNPGAPSARPWCGNCDPATRILDWQGDQPRRCPSCHPLTEPLF